MCAWHFRDVSRSTLILLRHGRPALSRNVRLRWRDYEEWWRSYDAGGLRAGNAVPPKVEAMVEGADMVVSSPLPRALESARLAAGREPDRVLPDFVEAPLPPPRLPVFRARPITWGTVSRVVWMAGYSRDCESAAEARERAGRVADELAGLADGKMVLAFGHGWFNRMVGWRLRRAGWRVVSGRGDGYWSHRTYERDE